MSFFARHFWAILALVILAGFASRFTGDPLGICTHGKCEPIGR